MWKPVAMTRSYAASIPSRVARLARGGALLGLIRLLSHDRTIDGISATDTVTERVLCLLGVAPQEAHILATTPLSQST